MEAFWVLSLCSCGCGGWCCSCEHKAPIFMQKFPVRHRLHSAHREFRGPVTAVSSFEGALLLAAGHRLERHELQVRSRQAA